MAAETYADLLDNPLEQDTKLNLIYPELGEIIRENADLILEAKFRKPNSDGKTTTRQTPRVFVYRSDNGYGYMLYHKFSGGARSGGSRYVSMHKPYISKVLADIFDRDDDSYYRIDKLDDDWLESELESKVSSAGTNGLQQCR